MLVAVGHVPAKELQPLGARHDLEVALEAGVHLRAVDNRAAAGVVGHLLQRHRRPEHVAGELLSALGVIARHAHPVVHREPAEVPPFEQARSKLGRDRPRFDEEIEHRLPKPLPKQLFRHALAAQGVV